MGIVALSVLARVIQVGLAPYLVAQIVDAVHVAVVGAGERVLVVVERALGLDDEVAGGDALVLLVALEGEVGEHRQSADGGAAQGVTVLDALQTGCLADVLDHDGEARSSRATKDGTDEEDAVALAEDVAEGFELVAVLDLVQRYAADVGTAHKADVHLVLQLVVGKQERRQRLVGLVHRVIADELAELAVLDGTQVEDERVVQGHAGVAHDFAQGDNAVGEKSVGVGLVAVELAADVAVVVEHRLGALQVLVGLVRVDDDGHNFQVLHRLAVLVKGTHAGCRQHQQRLEYPGPGTSDSKKE